MHELNHEMFGSVTYIIAKVSKHMIGVSKHMFGNVTYCEKLVETLIKKYDDCVLKVRSYKRLTYLMLFLLINI